MSNISVDTIAGPAYLAAALVNGDTSGLDAAGLAELRRFRADLAPYRVVGTEDSEEYVGRYRGQLCHLIEYVCYARLADLEI